MILPWDNRFVAAVRIPRESGDDPVQDLSRDLADVVFPARAGMIPILSHRPCNHSRIPRESGDDPSSRAVWWVGQAYSPRERG